jgi:predicted acetyltransferase
MKGASMLKLIEPVIELRAEFLAMIEEFEAEDRDTIDGIGCIEADDFEDSVRRANILCVHRNKTRVTGRKYFDWHWKKRGA